MGEEAGKDTHTVELKGMGELMSLGQSKAENVGH